VTDVLEHDDAGQVHGKTAPGVPGAAGPRRPRWVTPVGFALIVLLTVALVAVIHFGMAAGRGFGSEHDRDQAVAAAQEAAVNMTTLDGTNAEADIQRLLASTTPDFAAGFAGGKDSFAKKLRENKVQMTGTVTGAGLVSYDGAKSTVILAVRTHQTGAAQAAPDQDTDYRMLLHMEKLDGDWLASRAEFVE
jgi:Mce-associated membrane protein